MHPMGCAPKNPGLTLTQSFSRCGIYFIPHVFHIWGKRLRLNIVRLKLSLWIRPGVNRKRSAELARYCQESFYKYDDWTERDKISDLHVLLGLPLIRHNAPSVSVIVHVVNPSSSTHGVRHLLHQHPVISLDISHSLLFDLPQTQ